MKLDKASDNAYNNNNSNSNNSNYESKIDTTPLMGMSSHKQTQSLSSPYSPATSRFEFLSDTKAPTELSKLEEETLRRRSLFRRRVNDIDNRIAAWTTRLTHETVERDVEHIELIDSAIHERLEAAAERIFDRLDQGLTRLLVKGDQSPLEENVETTDIGIVKDLKNGNDNDEKMEESKVNANSTTTEALELLSQPHTSSLQTIQRKVHNISVNLAHHKHVSSQNAFKENIHSLRTSIRTQIQPSLELEKSKADKREGGMVQKFESIAGLAWKSYRQENATRVAELELLKERIEQSREFDQKRTERFMKEIEYLKKILEEERAERIKRDELVVDKIIETRELLQRTVLESLGND